LKYISIIQKNSTFIEKKASINDIYNGCAQAYNENIFSGDRGKVKAATKMLLCYLLLYEIMLSQFVTIYNWEDFFFTENKNAGQFKR